jgi:hypothetical protein
MIHPPPNINFNQHSKVTVAIEIFFKLAASKFCKGVNLTSISIFLKLAANQFCKGVNSTSIFLLEFFMKQVKVTF